MFRVSKCLTRSQKNMLLAVHGAAGEDENAVRGMAAHDQSHQKQAHNAAGGLRDWAVLH